MPSPETTADGGLALGRSDDGRPTSAEEFAAADFEAPYTYEQVAGRLVVMSPEGTGHVIQSVPWQTRLAAFAFQHPEIIQAVVSQAWIKVDEDNSRIADIAVYLGGPLEALEIPDQVPDLVFEFVSPGKKNRQRDYVEKRAEYERIGVREYVIVDRFDRKVTILTLGDNSAYAERALLPDATYRTPLLPGFEVPLGEVLPR